jgi:UDP-N-acetylmuramoyl-tripeptide--D-alanyl-D-alanine ligase
MKNLLKNLLIKILFWESSLILNKFKPKIVAITGNIGKTTTKEYIGQILNFKYAEKVRYPAKSLNSDIGVTLTILNQPNAWDSYYKWFKVITLGFWKQYFGEFPEILVLEIGADHPGDIKKLTEIVTPDIVVLTAFQELPTHAEFFSSKEEHIREKKYLVDALKENGVLVCNIDDSIMYKLAEEKNGVTKLYFGKDPKANVVLKDVQFDYDNESILTGMKNKLKFNFENDNDEIEISIFGIVGYAQSYSLSAGVLVAKILGMKNKEIESSLESFVPANSRMRLLKGVYGSTIIDDSYNASPEAFKNSFQVLEKIFVKGKKVCVVGHMAELGHLAKEAHMQVGKELALVANKIILSGRYNDLYLEALRQTDFPEEKIFISKNAEEAIEVIQSKGLLCKNDLLFVKGSQSARLDKVVAEFLYDKRDLKFVARQEVEWVKR